MSAVPPPPPMMKAPLAPTKKGETASVPDLLADIRAGKTLRKVPESAKRDRSAPLAQKKEAPPSEPTTGGILATSNQNAASSGPAPIATGPINFGNIFANGIPKLKPVNSHEPASHSSVARQPMGYSKSTPAPPPPVAPSPPPTIIIPTAAAPSPVPPQIPSKSSTPSPTSGYNHQSGETVKTVRNGAPPTPVRPNICRTDSNYTKYMTPRNYVSQDVSVVPTSPQQHQQPPPPPPPPPPLPSQPAPPAPPTVAIKPNVTVTQQPSSMSSHPHPSRRKSSTTNRYQRVGSTNMDNFGTPLERSNSNYGKSIHINAQPNFQSSKYYQPPPPPPPPPPPVPQTVDYNGTRAHPPPPPPPPPPSNPPLITPSNHNNNTANNFMSVTDLVREFERRFTFLPDKSLPAPPIPYMGPKTYRQKRNRSNNPAGPQRFAPMLPNY